MASGLQALNSFDHVWRAHISLLLLLDYFLFVGTGDL
jgi:hypothetical protein